VINSSVQQAGVSAALDLDAFAPCFRCEGAECPKCSGSGHRGRKRCAGCGVPAGRPSQGGKVLSPERGAKSGEELRSLPLYCIDCNPRFSGARLELFEEMGG
jgi:hypothetical protein